MGIPEMSVVPVPAKIIKVQDDTHVVINRGSNHGAKIGQRYILYRITGEMLMDPDTGEKLGKLEIALGTGKVSYVHEKWSTIESDMPRLPQSRVTRKTAGIFTVGSQLEITEVPSDGMLSFDNPQQGDYAKPI